MLEREQQALAEPTRQRSLGFATARAEPDRARRRPESFDADILSPREALALLYELVELAKG